MCSLYLTILILGFIPGVYMVTCPKEGDMYPCTCKDYGGLVITVICSRGSFIKSYPLKILHQALSTLTGRKDIELLFKNSVIRIPSNFFAGIGIRYLEFQSCRIDSLGNDDGMLTGLENSLQALRISDCSIVPPRLNLGHLKRLSTIDWSGNNMTELTDDWLSYSYSLKYLTIKRSNITKIGSYAFYHLINLYSLILKDTSFGPLKRSMFPRMGNRLSSLVLENNELSDLPVDLFSDMPFIKVIYLQRNKITSLDERTWSPIWQHLHDLWLQDNKIVCDDRLRWISKTLKNAIRISGQCSAPKEIKGMALFDFFRS